MNLVNLNGKIKDARSALIYIDNRSFRYGDGLFETIRVVNGKVVSLEQHLQRLFKGMEVLKLNTIQDSSTGFWRSKILELCLKNNCEKEGRVRLTVYRNAGGYYTPGNSSIAYLVEAEKNKNIFSNINAKGLHIGVYEDIKKALNLLGGLKTANCLIYVLAGIAKEQNRKDEMIILNQEGRAIEAISSNIFVVSNGVVKTPRLNEGCVAGVTRDWLITKMKEMDIAVQETQLELDDIRNADEVFISNAIQGIQRVSNFENIVYQDKLIRHLSSFKPELD